MNEDQGPRRPLDASEPHPRRPRLILSLGVCGHRPGGLASADMPGLRAEARRVLSLASAGLRQARSPDFRGEPALLRVVTSLADGSDRLIAEEALGGAAGAAAVQLQCPLPFSKDEYAKDFTPESRTRFDALLAGSAALELDGSRADERSTVEGYEQAADVLLDQSDVLVAIWDGLAARGRGGTAETVLKALRRGLPTVWIHAGAEAAHASCLAGLDAGQARCGAPIESLSALIAAQLRPPAPLAQTGARPDLRGAFFAERRRRWSLGFLWRFFRDGVASGRPGLPALRVPPLEESAGEEWSKSAPAVRAPFAWADGLANYYANLYRSAFLANYLLGGVAVLCALLPLALGWSGREHPLHRFEPAFVVAELGVILAILLNATIGIRGRWHERWIDYRLLAEYLRQIRFLGPLGRNPLLSSPPARQRSDDLRGTWAYWYARAVAREAGLPSGRLDAAALAAHAADLQAFVGGQLSYHERTARILGAVNRRLWRAGLALFGGTFAACAAHLAVHSPWLTLVSAVLPAFGAAFAGIRGQGEFEVIVRRSEAAAAGLERIARELHHPRAKASSRAQTAVAEAASTLMIEETLSWRFVSESRPLELSG